MASKAKCIDLFKSRSNRFIHIPLFDGDEFPAPFARFQCRECTPSDQIRKLDFAVHACKHLREYFDLNADIRDLKWIKKNEVRSTGFIVQASMSRTMAEAQESFRFMGLALVYGPDGNAEMQFGVSNHFESISIVGPVVEKLYVPMELVSFSFARTYYLSHLATLFFDGLKCKNSTHAANPWSTSKMTDINKQPRAVSAGLHRKMAILQQISNIIGSGMCTSCRIEQANDSIVGLADF